MAKLSITGGVPKAVGGYNYSTDKSQNTLFNQGLVPGDPGATQTPYPYGAKANAAAMYSRTGNQPIPIPREYDYGTKARKAAKIRRHDQAINQK